MREIIAHVEAKDTDAIESFARFVPAYKYGKDRAHDPCEWGSVDLAEWGGCEIRGECVRIRFLVDVEARQGITYSIRNVR